MMRPTRSFFLSSCLLVVPLGLFIASKIIVVFLAIPILRSDGGLDLNAHALARIGLLASIVPLCGYVAAVFGFMRLLAWRRIRYDLCVANSTRVEELSERSSQLATIAFALSLLGLSLWPLSVTGISCGAVARVRHKGGDRIWARLSMAAIVIGVVGMIGPIASAYRPDSLGNLLQSTSDAREPAGRGGSAGKECRAVLVLAADISAGEILTPDSVIPKNIIMVSGSEGIVLESDRVGIVGKAMRLGGRKGDVLLWSYLRKEEERPTAVQDRP